MNLASIILLLLILAATGYTIFKTICSKGACEDCQTTTCPVKGLATQETKPQNTVQHDCCQ